MYPAMNLQQCLTWLTKIACVHVAAPGKHIIHVSSCELMLTLHKLPLLGIYLALCLAMVPGTNLLYQEFKQT